MKTLLMLILTLKNMTNKMMYIVQDPHAFPCSFQATLVISFPLIFSLHASTNLSINIFLHLQFLCSKYSPTLHDLSHSQSQLPGF